LGQPGGGYRETSEYSSEAIYARRADLSKVFVCSAAGNNFKEQLQVVQCSLINGESDHDEIIVGSGFRDEGGRAYGDFK
jgi:hypothetical protein